MRITRTADYGVRLMTELAAAQPGTRLTVAELSQKSQSSLAFTAKILQRLVAARLAISHRGFEGGFELARPADTISMLDIVAALDGNIALNECEAEGLRCDRAPNCAARRVWMKAQEAMAQVLGAESLAQMASGS